jgi:outer membrane murein-binding lipoprotein Lpp
VVLAAGCHGGGEAGGTTAADVAELQDAIDQLRADLDATRTDLAGTRSDLAAARDELDEANDRIDVLERGDVVEVDTDATDDTDAPTHGPGDLPGWASDFGPGVLAVVDCDEVPNTPDSATHPGAVYVRTGLTPTIGGPALGVWSGNALVPDRWRFAVYTAEGEVRPTCNDPGTGEEGSEHARFVIVRL